MFFAIYIGFIGLVIVAVSVIAIVMSTTQGSNWMQTTWRQLERRGRRPAAAPDERPPT